MSARKMLRVGIAVVAASLALSAGTFAAPSTARYLYFNVKSPVARGQLAHVVVQGRTGLCRISVSKGGTQMQYDASLRVNPLRPKLSSDRLNDTRVAWQWHVPTNTPLGLWRVRVKCGHAATLHGTFLVTG